ELIGSLQHEVNILLHLASKIDRAELDYRPTPKQSSSLELLQYLTIMGPALLQAAKAGTFDPAAWTAAAQAVAGRNLDYECWHRAGFASRSGATPDGRFRGCLRTDCRCVRPDRD